MRAIFCEIDSSVSVGTEITIEGERAHHLMVVRIKNNEELLILNGKGHSFKAMVLNVSKKEISVKTL